MSAVKKIILLLAVSAAVGLTALGCILYKDFTYTKSEEYVPDKTKKHNILVVYYSRSGNTEIMAREIGRRYNTDILSISADYPLSYSGWRKASRDASDNVTETQIRPETVDLKKYKYIFLGSPIWWYRPAPPLWTFVKKNNFNGAYVILFNTFNSRFKEENITEFRNLVEKQDGKFTDHIYIKRGRIMNQLNTEELVNEIRELLKKKEPEWKISG